MAEWIVCEQCGLEHDEQRVCPRCKVQARAGANAPAAPSTWPTRNAAPSTADLVPPRRRPAPPPPAAAATRPRGQPRPNAEVTSARRKVMLMAIGMILVGGLAFWVGVDERRTTRAIVDHGKPATATVDKVTWTQKGTVNKREYSFRAEVHFATEKGVISTKLDISDERGRALRDQLRDGKSPVLKVVYLPEQVASVRLANLDDDSRLFLAIGFVLVGVGIGFFLWLSVIKSREAAY